MGSRPTLQALKVRMKHYILIHFRAIKYRHKKAKYGQKHYSQK